MRLEWDDVPGARVTYEVEQRKPRWWIIPDPKWQKLPFDDFLIDFNSSSALISGLDYDSKYHHRIRALRGGQFSEWSKQYETKVPLPFIGHQADHTVKYELGVMPTLAPVPTPDDPGVVIPTAIDTAADAWNEAVSTSEPYLLFCKGKECESPSDLNTDGRTVIITTVSEYPDCGYFSVCVKSRDGSSNNYVDTNGHMNNLEIIIEEPATQMYESGGLLLSQRFRWTNNRNLHDKLHEEEGKYQYFPPVVMHEFGHAAGLHDLYNFSLKKYVGYIMFQPEKQTSVPKEDRDYLRDVYRNHSPHENTLP